MSSNRPYPGAFASYDKRKPGKVVNIVIDLLDDRSYTICGYDDHHVESRKLSAQGPKDMMAKVMGLLGKTSVTDKLGG